MSKAKAKGTWWESAIVKWFRARGVPARRTPLAGSADKGDITWGDAPAVVIEAKNRKVSAYPAAVREAEEEARNAGASVGMAWVKVVGKGTVDGGLVLLSPETAFRLLAMAGLLVPGPALDVEEEA